MTVLKLTCDTQLSCHLAVLYMYMYVASFELAASLSRVLLSCAMRACACLGYLTTALVVVALSCDGGVVEDECYQLLLAPVDTYGQTSVLLVHDM